MTKIVSYASDRRGYNATHIMNDNEYFKLNNEVMACKDRLISFSIRLVENEKESMYNPIIDFVILGSEYDYKKKTIPNYEEMLFDDIRREFKEKY